MSSDGVYLNGPEANTSREHFLEVQKEAQAGNISPIITKLCATFVTEPIKTIDELTDEETLIHIYALEQSVRDFRIHLLELNRSKEKRRAKAGAKVFDQLDANYKPKPIPESQKANTEEMKLAAKMAKSMDISVEDALAMLRK